jgi:RNA polymerase sigma-70 factor (ECF subfamily)
MLKLKDLYSLYARDVYRFALWLSGSGEETKDITSETFIRAWMKLSSIRTETLKGYLLKIARNVYLGHLREQRKLSELEDTHTDPSPGQEESAEVRSAIARIQAFLKTLPEVERSAFVIRIKYELPYAEIARILQIS